jgi:hypothetical protein
LGAPVFEFLRRVFGNGLPASDGEERTRRDMPTSELIRRLPYEAFPVAGAKAIEAVLKLHRDQPQKTAFIIGHPEDFGLFCEFMGRGHLPDASLKAGAALTYEAWIAAREKEREALLAEFDDDAEDELHGPWPSDVEPSSGFLAPIDHHGLVRPELIVGLSPAPLARWWETFAHTRFGAWNLCPPPEVHIMLHHRWAQDHGAILMAHGYDTIELSVARPIRRRDEAMRMAEIHHKYCPDNVEGAGTFEEYAASLIGSTTWSFWWD